MISKYRVREIRLAGWDASRFYLEYWSESQWWPCQRDEDWNTPPGCKRQPGYRGYGGEGDVYAESLEAAKSAIQWIKNEQTRRTVIVETVHEVD